MKRAGAVLALIGVMGFGCGPRTEPVGDLAVRALREVLPGEKVVGPRTAHPQGGYSFCPPIRWRPGQQGARSSKTSKPETLKWTTTFTDPQSGGSLIIGVLDQGPPMLDRASLERSLEGILSALRRQGIANVKSDIFRFKKFAAIQTGAQVNDRVMIQLLVMERPDSALWISWNVPVAVYPRTLRTIEAVLASLEWSATVKP